MYIWKHHKQCQIDADVCYGQRAAPKAIIKQYKAGGQSHIVKQLYFSSILPRAGSIEIIHQTFADGDKDGSSCVLMKEDAQKSTHNRMIV